MIKNYLKIAVRNLRKHTGYTVINVLGLAAGLACALLILLFVRDELSYDRFHEKADRIVRVSLEFEGFGAFARAPVLAGPYFAESYPEIETAIRFYQAATVLHQKEELINEQQFFYVDPEVFDVFTFPLIAGDPATALKEPGTVVLTETTARRYFGTADPIGQILTLGDGSSLRVTGVAKDVPSNAHFHFDFLASFATLGEVTGFGNQSFTYCLLHEGATMEALQEKIDIFTEQDSDAIDKALGFSIDGMRFNLQPLTRLHLHSDLGGEPEPTSDVRYLYIFSAIGLFLLLIAAINYMNLATARATRRAREVGVRKALGAGRGQLIQQFIGESMLLSGLSFVLALVFMEGLLPAFNNLTGKALITATLFEPGVMGLFLAVLLCIGLLAGSYPAFYLSRFKPARVLKGTSLQQAGGVWVRRGLVTFQFTVSVVLICGTLVVLKQLDYIQSKRLGYDTEQVLMVPLRGLLSESADAFKQEVETLPGVQRVALADIPTGGMMANAKIDDAPIRVRYLGVDTNYLETMGLTLSDGRNFDPQLAADTASIIINETAARLFGLEDQVGQMIDPPRFLNENESERLIGIVSDFHVASLHEAIMPTVLNLDRSAHTAVLRLDPARFATTLPEIEAVWKQFVSDHPFRYRFLDELLLEQYEAEQRLGRIFSIFAVLAISIAGLGLFGLAAFTAEQRTKEIGIRKVLGATASSIVVLLSKEFLRLVLIAAGLGIPVAYLLMQNWLEDFAYRTDLSVGIFLVVSSLTLTIALLTVSYHAIRSAQANPVDSLRYE